MEKRKECKDWFKIEDKETLMNLLNGLNSWELLEPEKSDVKSFYKLSKKIKAVDFVDAIEFFNKVAKVAEEVGHHPDLHLTSFKNIEIVIYTYSLKGLTENDFIIAKRIDEIPI